MDAGDDPYKILGVTTDATERDIKNSYRKLALKHHPDKNPNDPHAHATFAKISNAYELLTDEEERKYYDWEHGNQNNNNKTANFGGDGVGGNRAGMPFQSSSTPNKRTSTTTSSSSSTFRPQRSKKEHTFHDPFSVFAEVFQEEFGDDFFPQHPKKKKSGSTTTTSDAQQEGPPPPGGKQISMQKAMKTINCKSVTVTERVYEMPDGSLQTRIEKEVEGGGSGGGGGGRPTTASAPNKKRTSTTTTTSTMSGNKPRVTVQIVNGVKETTTEYPDGRTETKCEPLDNNNSNNNMATPGIGKKATPQTKKHTNKTPSNDQVHVTTQIINGIKETTTHYPDGRCETKCEPINNKNNKNSNGGGSCTPTPTSRPIKNHTATTRHTKSSNASQPEQGQTRTTTKIVNGMKETTTHYPDGRTETKMEMVQGQSSLTPTVGRRPSSTTKTTTSSFRPKTTTTTKTTVLPIPPSLDINSSALKMKSPRPNGGGSNTTSRQSTRIVNGKKEITIEHTITHPDGSTETRMENRIEAC